ncbi:MAG: right-handed parallel beta-helix repeat-containing protein [Candidatus Bathyarchaeota archaeon]|nr:right-handed parallel beta-helix repeat-containing protein [Candidatus Bathyarchaeota archaeon]
MKSKAITGIVLTLLLMTTTFTLISTNIPSMVRSHLVQVFQGESTTWDEDITDDTTWHLADSPYILVEDIKVYTAALLTIEPGVVVKFADGTELYIAGGLNAQGNTTHPITFTSNFATPAPGIWDSVIYDGVKEFLLDYVLIEYASIGAKLVSVANISNSIISNCNIGVEGKLSHASNLTVTNSTGDGLSLSGSPRIENSTILNNGACGITITTAIYMDNCIVSNNTEDGVILSNGGDIKNSLITDNGGNGTCILGPAKITNTTISANCGDGIWTESRLEIVECNINGNQRNGIKSDYVDETTKIDESTISRNGGDGIWMGSRMIITECSITENAGNGTSAHLLVDGFDFEVQRCNVSSNGQNGVTVPRNSSSEYINMNIEDSTITYNNMSGLSGRGHVENSTVSGNKMCGILGNYTIELYNFITGNQGGGFNGTGIIYWSSIFNNTPYDVVADVSPNNITALENWWGTTDRSMIEDHIWDHNDTEGLGHVFYEPRLFGIPEPIDAYSPEIFVTSPYAYSGISPSFSCSWAKFCELYETDMIRMGEPASVSVNVTDNTSPVPSGVDKVFLLYRVLINQSAGEWWNKTMNLATMYNETSGNWNTTIPGHQVPCQWTNLTIQFFIQAYDKDANSARSPPENDYYSYRVVWLPSMDINGDGKVRIDDVLAVALGFGWSLEI